MNLRQSWIENEENDQQRTSVRRPANGFLILGLALVLLIAILAVFGPQLAPRDPLDENIIIQIGESWRIPPFPFFTPGFPLGSDEFGRDLYSRLLWAIQPTMIMVVSVAVVRLVLGTIIGLFAGWSGGRIGRGLDTLIDGALAIPVLLVALGAIAVVGVELGIWAFIIGLSITGWVESAQQVREQTRIIKTQVFVEAAHALGASSRQILFGHIARQVSPMFGMLFAFEVSSTLMTTAGLGFLGYYIGGDVWVMVVDFVWRRTSGMPELGQMLATSWSTLTQPWAMVATGTTIFVAVLGFNLLGEGLRQNLQITVHRQSLSNRVSRAAVNWLDEYLWYPLSGVMQKPALRLGLISALALVLVAGAGFRWGGDLWDRVQSGQETSPLGNSSNQPSAQQEPGRQATNEQPTPTPAGPQFTASVAWEFTDTAGFAGGPVLSPGADLLYAVNRAGIFYALDLSGQPLWQVELAAGGAGTPAIGSDGAVYVSDRQGGLSAISPNGDLLWRYQPAELNRSISGPAIGPDQTVYYVLTTGSKGFVQGVTADGQHLWLSEARTAAFYQPLNLSPDGRYVFLKEDAFDAQSGELQEWEAQVPVLRYFPGQDGDNYLLAGQTVSRWEVEGNRIQLLERADWQSPHSPSNAPTQAGVTAEHVAWLLYTSPGGSTGLYWVGLEEGLLGEASHRFSRGQMIQMDADLTAFVCGGQPFSDDHAECAALSPQDGVRWKLPLGTPGLVEGGFWHDSHLYVATTKGTLFAIRQDEGQADENQGLQQVTPTSIQTDQTGLVWSYPLEEDEVELIRFGSDGTAYLRSRTNRIYTINAQGQLKYSLELPTGYAEMSDSRGDSWPVYPTLLSDGSLFIVSDRDNVFIVNPSGEIPWEIPFTAKLFHSHLIAGQAGEVYLVDDQAGLYCFDSTGMCWHFQSQAAPYTANGPVIGPDGSIFYTITTRGKGFVQAVSANGQSLWASQAETGSFYDRLALNPHTGLVFLKNDVFDMNTGELLEMDIPFPVNRIFGGADGHNYLLSGSSVLQWTLGDQGFEILNQALIPHDPNFPPQISVEESGLIRVQTFLFNRSSSVTRTIWLTPDGEVVGSLDYEYIRNDLLVFDEDGWHFTRCSRKEIDQPLECARYKIGSDEPVWRISLEGVPPFSLWKTALIPPYLYVLDEDGKLSKFHLGEPTDG
jgi:ABC-type dipeptide/oligopeptide/nickel transport system permease subunit